MPAKVTRGIRRVRMEPESIGINPAPKLAGPGL